MWKLLKPDGAMTRIYEKYNALIESSASSSTLPSSSFVRSSSSIPTKTVRRRTLPRPPHPNADVGRHEVPVRSI